MKICLSCKTEFCLESWICPACKWIPQLIDGFHSFSPEFAYQNDGLPSDTHHKLEELQEKSFWFRVRNQLIQDAIHRYFRNASNVLELGCGSGFVLNGIRDILPTANLTATEIYANGLAYAAQKVQPPTQFLQVDARKLPFKNEFDLVGAFDVLEHIEEDDVVINNIWDALKSGGGVMLTVPQHPSLWSKADDLACHKRRYTTSQLSNQLKKQGFDILLNTSFMFFLMPLMLLQRLFANRKSDYDQTKELALPIILDKTFEYILTIERYAIRCGLSFPIGGSRLLVARKLNSDMDVN